MIALINDDLLIDYFDAGSGPVLVLLHAFPQTNEMWHALSEKWQRDFRVIAPNARGFGQTTFRDNWSLEESADDVAQLIENLGIQTPIALCGLSMGGYTALAFARRHAEKLGALILADTRAEADDDAGKQKRDEMIEQAKNRDAAEIFDQMAPHLFSQHTLSMRPDLVQASRNIAATLSRATVVAALKALRDRPDAVPQLSQIKVPTLILRGAADELSPPSSAQTFLDEISHVRLQTLEGAGHYSHLERAGDFETAVRDFVRSAL